MQRLFEFIAHHPYLASVPLLAAVRSPFMRCRRAFRRSRAVSNAGRTPDESRSLVLDLRSKDSFDAGHIGDARNVPAAILSLCGHLEEVARQERHHL